MWKLFVVIGVKLTQGIGRGTCWWKLAVVLINALLGHERCVVLHIYDFRFTNLTIIILDRIIGETFCDVYGSSGTYMFFDHNSITLIEVVSFFLIFNFIQFLITNAFSELFWAAHRFNRMHQNLNVNNPSHSFAGVAAKSTIRETLRLSVFRCFLRTKHKIHKRWSQYRG